MTAECLGETCKELTRSKKIRLTKTTKKSCIEKSHNWKWMISKKQELSYRSHNSSSLLSHKSCFTSSSPQQQIQGGKELNTTLPVRENREKEPSYRTIADFKERSFQDGSCLHSKWRLKGEWELLKIRKNCKSDQFCPC